MWYSHIVINGPPIEFNTDYPHHDMAWKRFVVFDFVIIIHFLLVLFIIYVFLFWCWTVQPRKRMRQHRLSKTKKCSSIDCFFFFWNENILLELFFPNCILFSCRYTAVTTIAFTKLWTYTVGDERNVCYENKIHCNIDTFPKCWMHSTVTSTH